MLPLSLLKTAINHPMLVELKNGETYNGHLASCDAWMNVYLIQVICTSRDGDRFWKMPECYIRGSTIKYLRIPDEVIENYKEDSSNRAQNQIRKDNLGRGKGPSGSAQRGGRGSSGAGRGGFQGNQGNRRPNQNMTGSNNNLPGTRPAKQQRR